MMPWLLMLMVAMHSRSEGKARFTLDEHGRIDVLITLSTLDMPELCDVDLSASDPAVREERVGVLDTCIRRELPELLRVRADDALACNVVTESVAIEKGAVAIHAFASCAHFPNDRVTVDWGLFAGQPIDHVTVTTFAQPYDDPRLVMLSKRASKLVVEVGHPLWPFLAAGTFLAVVLAAIVVVLLAVFRKRNAAAAVLFLLAGTDARAEEEPKFRVEDRVAVREKIRADAEVCLVHLHGNEENAREVMMELASSSCANALWLDDARYPPGMKWGDDRIPVPNVTMDAKKCTVNPNRILTPAAFKHRIANDCEGDEAAARALRRFLDEKFLPALERCRAKGLPVVTFHNNSNLTVRDMDAMRAKQVDERKSDILFVTQLVDYERLVSLKKWSVAIQSRPPADDGSLSVLFKDERYINVEAQIAPQNKMANKEMGEWALRSVGGLVCGDGDWPEHERERERERER